jgi:hypothetical protein
MAGVEVGEQVALSIGPAAATGRRHWAGGGDEREPVGEHAVIGPDRQCPACPVSTVPAASPGDQVKVVGRSKIGNRSGSGKPVMVATPSSVMVRTMIP